MRARTKILMAGVALVTVTGALIFRFPAPALSEALSRHARTVWDLSVSSAEASVSVLRGTKLGDVSVRLTSEHLLLAAEIEGVVLDHWWVPGTPLTVDRVVLLRPDIHVTVGRRSVSSSTAEQDVGAETPSPSRPSSDDGRVSLVRFRNLSLVLEEATLRLRPPSGNDYTLEAVRLTASLHNLREDPSAGSPLQSFLAEGLFRADALLIGPVQLMDAHGQLSIDRGQVRLTDLRFTCRGSQLLLPMLDIDFRTEPFALTTRDNVLERTLSAPDSSPAWVPLGSLLQLGDICR